MKKILKEKRSELFGLVMGKWCMVAVLMAGLMAIQGCGSASMGVGLNLETVTKTKAVLKQLENQSFSYNADQPEVPQDPISMQSSISSSRLSMPNFSESSQPISFEFNGKNINFDEVSCRDMKRFYSHLIDDVSYTYVQTFRDNSCSDDVYETELHSVAQDSGESGNIFYEKRRENEVISKFSESQTDSGTKVIFIDKETYPHIEMQYNESGTNESYESLTVTYKNGAQFKSGTDTKLELSVRFNAEYSQAAIEAFKFKLNLDDSNSETRIFTGNFKFATDENTMIDYGQMIDMESMKYYVSDLYDEASLKVARILIDENEKIHIAYYDTNGNLGEYSPKL